MKCGTLVPFAEYQPAIGLSNTDESEADGPLATLGPLLNMPVKFNVISRIEQDRILKQSLRSAKEFSEFDFQ